MRQAYRQRAPHHNNNERYVHSNGDEGMPRSSSLFSQSLPLHIDITQQALGCRAQSPSQSSFMQALRPPVALLCGFFASRLRGLSSAPTTPFHRTRNVLYRGCVRVSPNCAQPLALTPNVRCDGKRVNAGKPGDIASTVKYPVGSTDDYTELRSPLASVYRALIPIGGSRGELEGKIAPRVYMDDGRVGSWARGPWSQTTGDTTIGKLLGRQISDPVQTSTPGIAPSPAFITNEASGPEIKSF
ncbi:hypothetical protein AB1N83_008537 [Pleurotus pulmonarius]